LPANPRRRSASAERAISTRRLGALQVPHRGDERLPPVFARRVRQMHAKPRVLAQIHHPVPAIGGLDHHLRFRPGLAHHLEVASRSMGGIYRRWFLGLGLAATAGGVGASAFESHGRGLESPDAVGNGVTGDTSAINAALATISGTTSLGNAHQVIYFPPGRYRITGTLAPQNAASAAHLVGHRAWHVRRAFSFSVSHVEVGRVNETNRA
jgi:Pectate lyase superfamily protein